GLIRSLHGLLRSAARLISSSDRPRAGGETRISTQALGQVNLARCRTAVVKLALYNGRASKTHAFPAAYRDGSGWRGFSLGHFLARVLLGEVVDAEPAPRARLAAAIGVAGVVA